MQGLNQGPKEAIRIFVQLSGGGSAFGLAVGMAVTLWLRTMFENPSAEVPSFMTILRSLNPLEGLSSIAQGLKTEAQCPCRRGDTFTDFHLCRVRVPGACTTMHGAGDTLVGFALDR